MTTGVSLLLLLLLPSLLVYRDEFAKTGILVTVEVQMTGLRIGIRKSRLNTMARYAEWVHSQAFRVLHFSVCELACRAGEIHSR